MPSFTGPPDDAALAGQVWPLAEACAGRPARTAATVTLRRGAVKDGWAAAAQSGPEGLAEVVLAPDAQALALVHALAHAWTPTGPPGVVEGRTHLLELCVLRTLRPTAAALLADHARASPPIELFAWADPSDADPLARSRGHRAATALFLELEALLPPAELWSPALDGWDAVADAVLARRPDPAAWAALARLGRDTPWADLDGDGVPIDVERAWGRDPGVAEAALPRQGTQPPPVFWPDGSPEHVAALRAAIGAAQARADAWLPPRRLAPLAEEGPAPAPEPAMATETMLAPTPGAVVVGPGLTRVEDETIVHLGTDLSPLFEAGAWETLGAVAVALEVVWASPVRDLGLAEALAHDLTLGPAVATDLAPYELGAWQAAAIACPTGWKGVLEGRCPALEAVEEAPPGRLPR